MRIRYTIPIDAPPDAAWHVLGERFADIAAISSSLSESSLIGDLGVGAVRVCQGVGFGPFPPGETREELAGFDRDTRRFSYEAIEGLPWFIKGARNSWDVAEVPGGCEVTMNAEVDIATWLVPLGWALPWLMKRDLAKIASEIADAVRAHHLQVT